MQLYDAKCGAGPGVTGGSDACEQQAPMFT